MKKKFKSYQPSSPYVTSPSPDMQDEHINAILDIQTRAAIAHRSLMSLVGYGETDIGHLFTPSEIMAITLSIRKEDECTKCFCSKVSIAKMLGMSEKDILDIRKGEVKDKKVKALLDLTRNIMDSHFKPSNGLVRKFYKVGYSKLHLADLLELLAFNDCERYDNCAPPECIELIRAA